MMSIVLRSSRATRAFWLVLSTAIVLPACGGEGPAQVDPELAPFVGDWGADTLIVTSVANPDVHPDIIQVGATFTLNVQESGHYTAIVIYAGHPGTEFGTLDIEGSTIILRRDFPSASTSSSAFAFEGDDRFKMDGDTQFDFNLDGQPEAARAHIVLSRR